MTTQSDRERWKTHWLNFCVETRDAYLAGAEAKDLEWQAKVQGLVEFVTELSPAWLPENFRKRRHELLGKVAQFTSGQPASDEIEWEMWVKPDGSLCMVLNNETPPGYRKVTVKEVTRSIKGIGKDGG